MRSESLCLLTQVALKNRAPRIVPTTDHDITYSTAEITQALSDEWGVTPIIKCHCEPRDGKASWETECDVALLDSVRASPVSVASGHAVFRSRHSCLAPQYACCLQRKVNLEKCMHVDFAYSSDM